MALNPVLSPVQGNFSLPQANQVVVTPISALALNAAASVGETAVKIANEQTMEQFKGDVASARAGDAQDRVAMEQEFEGLQGKSKLLQNIEVEKKMSPGDRKVFDSISMNVSAGITNLITNKGQVGYAKLQKVVNDAIAKHPHLRSQIMAEVNAQKAVAGLAPSSGGGSGGGGEGGMLGAATEGMQEGLKIRAKDMTQRGMTPGYAPHETFYNQLEMSKMREELDKREDAASFRNIQGTLAFTDKNINKAFRDILSNASSLPGQTVLSELQIATDGAVDYVEAQMAEHGIPYTNEIREQLKYYRNVPGRLKDLGIEDIAKFQDMPRADAERVLATFETMTKLGTPLINAMKTTLGPDVAGSVLTTLNELFTHGRDQRVQHLVSLQQSSPQSVPYVKDLYESGKLDIIRNEFLGTLTIPEVDRERLETARTNLQTIFRKTNNPALAKEFSETAAIVTNNIEDQGKKFESITKAANVLPSLAAEDYRNQLKTPEEKKAVTDAVMQRETRSFSKSAIVLANNLGKQLQSAEDLPFEITRGGALKVKGGVLSDITSDIGGTLTQFAMGAQPMMWWNTYQKLDKRAEASTFSKEFNEQMLPALRMKYDDFKLAGAKELSNMPFDAFVKASLGEMFSIGGTAPSVAQPTARTARAASSALSGEKPSVITGKVRNVVSDTLMPGTDESMLGARGGNIVNEKELVKTLFDVVSSAESARAGYNAVGRGKNFAINDKRKPTEASVAEILEWQKNNGNVAIGRYQFIPDTLKEMLSKTPVSENDTFSEENQDILARALLERRGLKDFIDGKIDYVEFGNNLAKEWAGLPLLSDVTKKDGTVMKAGQSYYFQDAYGNKATISQEEFMNTLKRWRTDKFGTTESVADQLF